MPMEELQVLFERFAGFGTGDHGAAREMDGSKFAKLCKDCKLVDKKFTNTDVCRAQMQCIFYNNTRAHADTTCPSLHHCTLA